MCSSHISRSFAFDRLLFLGCKARHYLSKYQRHRNTRASLYALFRPSSWRVRLRRSIRSRIDTRICWWKRKTARLSCAYMRKRTTGMNEHTMRHKRHDSAKTKTQDVYSTTARVRFLSSFCLSPTPPTTRGLLVVMNISAYIMLQCPNGRSGALFRLLLKSS